MDPHKIAAAAAALATAYLLGSLPTAWIVVRLAGRGDIRTLGSGNVGASNTARVLGWGGFAAVFAVDALKGVAAVLLARRLMPDLHPGWAGWVAAAGHCWPLWLKFQGGKAVATGVGVLAALYWPAAAAGFATWAAVVVATRKSSLGALLGLVAAGVAVLGWGEIGLRAPFAALTVLIVWRHRGNLSRLARGTEADIRS